MSQTVKNLQHSRALIFGLIGLLFISQASRIESNLQENRLYRDTVGITPYKDVSIESQKFVDYGLAVSGNFIKRRCTFYNLTAYLTYDDKPKYRVSMLDKNGNLMTPNNSQSRPPSNDLESFGPWTIMGFSEDDPIGWEIHTSHVKCPTKPYQQDNLFASGKWEEK